jgi:hypothetical protein
MDGAYEALTLMVHSHTLLLEFVRVSCSRERLDSPVKGVPTMDLDEYLDSGKRTLETVKKYNIKLTDEEMAYLIACSL